MRRQAGQRGIRHSKNGIRLIIELLGNFFRVRLITLKQTFPHRINTTPEGGNPPHAGDCQTHASNFCITREAFVPPKDRKSTRLNSSHTEIYTLSLHDALPIYRINTTPEGGNPPHAGDCQTHASNFCITREAFVPPKPKEFERTVCKDAGRDSFATMLRSASSSGA